LSGGYSLLHSFDENLADYGDIIAQAGYNYQMTRKDTVGISYVFSGFRYDNFDESINTNTLLFSYGRKYYGTLGIPHWSRAGIYFINTPIIPGTGVGTIGPPSGGSYEQPVLVSLDIGAISNANGLHYRLAIAMVSPADPACLPAHWLTR
jgi:hypothetical protein